MNWVKRGLTTLLVTAVLGSSMPVNAATWIMDTEAGESVQEFLTLETPEMLDDALPVAATPAALEVGGKSAILMDIASGTVMYEKNAHEKLPIASVTKIMTLLLVMEALDEGHITLEEPVTCSPEAASMGGSQIWLEPAEIMSVHDLVKAAAVVSANDACAALAEHLCGSIEGFVERMNTRAAELGMNDTQFLDCSGLNDEAHSSAYDVALMSCELMKYPLIKQYTTIWMDTLRNGESQLVNTNKLVRFYQGITGLKTGTTSTAGHNLSATAERNGMGLAAVILGCSTTDERFGGARRMLDYGFAHYSLYTPQIDPASLTAIPVLRGVETQVETAVGELSPMLLKKGEEKQMTCTVKLAEDVEAPVEAGQIVGRVTVMKNGEECATYPVYAKTAVARLDFGESLKRLFRALCV